MGDVASRPFDLSEMLREELAMNWPILAAAVGFQTFANVLIDYLGGSDTFFVGSMVGVATQFWFYRLCLMRWDLQRVDSPNFFSFWGMCLMTGVCTFLSAIALLLPALYVNARWLAAGPMVVAEGQKAGDAMTNSWEKSRGVVWPVAGLTGLFYALSFGVAFYVAWQFEEVVPPEWNALLYLSTSFGIGLCWMVGVAVYRGTMDRTEQLVEVFA